MKRTYLLPELTVLWGSKDDVLTMSYIYDETNRDNIVVDPFAQRASAVEVASNHQNA